MSNPRLEEVTSAFQGAAQELAGILTARDQARFREVFSDVRGTFGDFTDEAVEQSRFLIDRLVELTSGRPSSSS
jgi:chorismate mutase/prephenate dehydrogenase